MSTVPLNVPLLFVHRNEGRWTRAYVWAGIAYYHKKKLVIRSLDDGPYEDAETLVGWRAWPKPPTAAVMAGLIRKMEVSPLGSDPVNSSATKRA
jgi:hypothetical protein